MCSISKEKVKRNCFDGREKNFENVVSVPIEIPHVAFRQHLRYTWFQFPQQMSLLLWAKQETHAAFEDHHD